MTQNEPDDGKAAEPDDPPAGGKSQNSAPDAVKDPNEKTDGHPGGQPQGDETDPGSG